MSKPTNFLSGVIEGFYGPPWSQAERFALFDLMSAWGLNTYLYAPKDDLKHRAIWRECYLPPEAEALREIIQRCRERRIHFIYALGPGLDIRYSSETDLDHLRKRCEQLAQLGCENFGLLFDDIPDRMAAEDAQRWPSFAAAQCHVTNALFQWTRERVRHARFFFCPTPYCGRMAERHYGGEGYLATVGRELLPEIDIFWTGPEIISQEITVVHILDLQKLLQRQPIIWDNLFANDYDGRRFYCGPFAGRPPELRAEVRGILVNPNNEFSLNFVPLRTLAQYVASTTAWDPREAYLAAMREWLPHYATVGAPVTLEDLTLFGDCYYLPYCEGANAEELFRSIAALLAADPAIWGNQVKELRQRLTRLRDFCARMTELQDRPLFYALSRRVWELREELDLLDRYVEFKSKPGNANAPFGSDFHLPHTYRGGMVPRLQQLLQPHPDATFTSSRRQD
jgi:protein O-GlcNAcase / histone acetyltransferase